MTQDGDQTVKKKEHGNPKERTASSKCSRWTTRHNT